MSVFTAVERTELMPWLAERGIQSLHVMTGITAGAVNTNYWLETDCGDWVLTLIEDRPISAVRPVMALMQALHEAGLPVPAVRADLHGNLVGGLCRRPATLVQAVRGQHPEVNEESAARIGEFLARLHALPLSLPALPLNFGPNWQRDRVAAWLPRLENRQATLMRQAWHSSAEVWARDWPVGWIHADLFPDNVLMAGSQLQGVIDWYFASQGPKIWDLAITLNAWGGAQSTEAGLNRALLAAYQRQHILTEAECTAVPAMRISAALRFWLSRLDAADRQDNDSDQVTVKSPADYERLLLDLVRKAGI